MARNEDYLDSLLDSINNSNTKPDDSDGLEDLKNILQSDSDYLIDEESSKDFSNSHSSNNNVENFDAIDGDPFKDPFSMNSDEDLEFLREFEKDMGIYDSRDEVFSDFETSKGHDSIKSDAEDSGDILSDILDIDSDAHDEYGSVETDTDFGADTLLDGLTDILSDADESTSAPVIEASASTEASDDSVMTDAGEDTPEAPAEDNAAESGDSDIISDVEDDIPAEDVIEDTEPNVSDDGGEPEGSDGAEDTDPDAISEEEIMNIGNLLDSIDEEGNVNLSEGSESSAPEGENAGDSSDKASEGTENSGELDEDKPEEKQNIFKKILGALFKKKEKSDEPEEEYSEYDFEEVIIPEEEIKAANLSKEEKKAQKQAEKEAKKKEKEEAKKKAAEEKAAKKKDKPVKEKKPKTKLVDKSPKIPIKVIIPFILLSVSLVVLWNVAKNTIAFELEFNSAKKAYDKQNYMSAYSKLSGMEITDEEDLMLVERARLMATLEMRYKAYELYYGEKKHIYAIDNLVRGAVFFADHERDANQVGIPSEFDTLGRQILSTLYDTYGVDAAKADELVEIRDRAEYTKELYHALEAAGLWSLED